jgi:translation initiation factor 5A
MVGIMTGEVKRKGAVNFQIGNYIVVDGAACSVTGIQTSRPGKHGHSKVRLEAIGIIDGKKRMLLTPGHAELDVPVIDKKNAQVLSVTGDMANVMDVETYETFDMAIPEELKGKITPETMVVYWIILNDRIMKQIKTG